ncbi:hypothetical protein BH11ARM1_BH11ARM1_04850 [soil metagenome]
MIPATFQTLLDDLAFFPDRQERIEALIALGDEFREEAVPNIPRDAAHRVPACESEVYVSAETSDNGLKFLFAVDNPQGISAMALAQMLDQGLSNQPLEQVLEVPDDIVYTIFGRELSMGKSAGLMGMVQKVKQEAAKHRP